MSPLIAPTVPFLMQVGTIYPNQYQQNTNNINIDITKNPLGTELTNNDITYLKGKLAMITDIYNIILKHLCHKRIQYIDQPTLLFNIKQEISSTPSVNNHASELCLSGSVGVTTATRVATATPPPTSAGAAANLVRDTVVIASNLPGANVASVIADSAAELVRINAIGGITAAETNAATAVDAAVSTAGALPGATTISLATAATTAALVYNPVAPRVPGSVVRKNAMGQCITPMFEDAKLTSLINILDNHNFITKACLFKQSGRYKVNINFVGGGDQENVENMELINLKDIMQENIQPPEKATILCIQANGQLKCAKLTNKKSVDTTKTIDTNKTIASDKNTKSRHCEFCERWTHERNMFKSVINDLLNAGNMNNTLELMSESSHLIPSAIMNQHEYHKFFSAIDKFKEAKKNGQL
jgi:hypothetical protein